MLDRPLLKLRRILTIAPFILGTALGIANTEAWAIQGLSSPLDAGGSDQLEPFRTVGSGWTTTSSGTSSLGAPVDLTWSMAPDGTNLPRGLGEPASPNNLIAFLDGIHQGGASPGGADLTQRDWFPLVESSFERWDAVSGVNFTYEPNDDGASFSPFTGGVLGTRGDYRIGGHSIDGQISPTFLAYNYFPNYAEMVIDTDEIDRWGNPEENFIRFRNMLMHEMGHGLGLNHLESSDADFLMEPFLATAFDGPQLDDILGIHRLYGDANEENGGNDTYLNATSLGKFRPGKSRSYGVDAGDAVVDPGDTDFLSIDDDSDVDFFRFTVKTPSLVDLTLTPLGPTYQEGRQNGVQTAFDTSAQSDLILTVFDSDGTSVLEFANNTGSGLAEEISSLRLDTAGEYFVQVQGMQNAAQFYQLDIDVEFAFPSNPFDLFDQFFGNSNPFDRVEDAFARIPLLTIFNVPEPSSGLLLFAGFAICGFCRRSR
ncbi:MAG: matrixin family metalloprotease [Planctomycetes bacterium]|nr:matrixin family metalloprotease [Planctomycetota bacterium]